MFSRSNKIFSHLIFSYEEIVILADVNYIKLQEYSYCWPFSKSILVDENFSLQAELSVAFSVNDALADVAPTVLQQDSINVS